MVIRKTSPLGTQVSVNYLLSNKDFLNSVKIIKIFFHVKKRLLKRRFVYIYKTLLKYDRSLFNFNFILFM